MHTTFKGVQIYISLSRGVADMHLTLSRGVLIFISPSRGGGVQIYISPRLWLRNIAGSARSRTPHPPGENECEGFMHLNVARA